MPEPQTRTREKRFPLAALAGGMLLATGLYGLLLWQVWYQHEVQERAHAANHRLIELATEITWLDQVLSMHARLAAATGDTTWEGSYLSLEAKLGADLAEASGLAESDVLARFLGQSAEANSRLAALERRVFDMARSGRPEVALALLDSPGYAQDKATYAQGMKNLTEALEDIVQANTDQGRRLGAYTAATGAVSLGVLAVAFALLWRLVRRAAGEQARRVEEATAELRQSNQRLESVLHAMRSGLAMYRPVDGGRDFVVLEFNRAAEAIEKLPRDQVVGRKVTDVFPGVEQFGLLDVMRRVLATGRPEHFPVTFYADDRITGWRDNFVYRLPSGEVATVYDDLTEAKRAENALRESEARLSLAVRSGNIGFWDWNAVTDTVVYSELWAEIIGHTPGEIDQSYSAWASRIHPDDHAATIASLTAHLEGKTPSFEQEHRLRTKDGGWRWVLGMGRVAERDPAGVPLRMTGVMVDIHARKQAEERLAESERRFRDVALTSGDWIWEVDTAGRYTYAAGRVKELLGYAPEELIGLTPFDLMPPGEAMRLSAAFSELAERQEPVVDLENRFRGKDGREGVLLTNGVPIYDPAGEFIGYFGVDKDITARKRDEFQLKLFAKVFETSLEGITVTDRHGEILAVNPAFTAITGYTAEEAVGQNPRVLKSDRHEPEFYQRMWLDLMGQGHWSGEIWNRRKSGEAYPEWLSISAIRDDSGATTHYVAVFHDITEMKHKEERIRHQAYHDALTDLPNRSLLLDRLHQAISRGHRTQERTAVLFVDLDNFKTINDSLGHAVGDKLLLAVAGRFQELVREGDTVARLGGDEFVLLVESLESERGAVLLANRVHASLEAPFAIEGHELFITPSIGIAFHPADGEDSATLLKNADLAMYQAKAAGRNRTRLFAAEMDERAQRRLALESDLRRAVQRREIYPVFQPRIDLASGAVAGMEALARWAAPDGRTVSPLEFIPVAEETGLILGLGQLILEEACAKARSLLDGGVACPRVSVNFSPRQFSQRALVRMVRDTLDAAGLSPDRLEMEITESVLLGDLDETDRKLRDLAAMGVRIAVDDFGTGYSSLAYLQRLPIHVLKIDRSFVSGIVGNPSDLSIARTIVQMGLNLGLTVLAEGAETLPQVDALRAMGCHEVQGFYFCKPLPFPELEPYLRRCAEPGGAYALLPPAP